MSHSANRLYCSKQCQRRNEKQRYADRKRLGLVTRRLDIRASFDADRYQGEQIADRDLAAYYRVLGCDPCCYCGEVSSERDHIVARSEGGGNVWTNYAAICSRCNTRKGSRSLLNFLLAWPLQVRRAQMAAELEAIGRW